MDESSFMVKRKDEAKAREILAATIGTVGAHGIAGLSMEAVARRAGVATGTLYVYHASKEALLDAAYLAVKAEVAASVFRDDAQHLAGEDAKALYAQRKAVGEEAMRAAIDKAFFG